MAAKKKKNKTSPLVVTFLLVAVGASLVAAAALMWAMPAVDAAGIAADELAAEQQQTEQARQAAARYTSVEELDQLVAQVQAADRLLPQRGGPTATDDLRLELPRTLSAAAASVGGSFTVEGFSVDTVPLVGMPVGLASARTSFTVTLPAESFAGFVAALAADGTLLTATSAEATAPGGTGVLRPGAPVEFNVTGLVWWTTTPAANLGSLVGPQ